LNALITSAFNTAKSCCPARNPFLLSAFVRSGKPPPVVNSSPGLPIEKPIVLPPVSESLIDFNCVEFILE